DYVGDKVVNGHCDCMFLINSFHWPWSYIAALIAPRPMLFANSGHDTIFPMTGNDRIRTRLERLYGFYTNRTDRLFDIGVTPGGHDDNPELRLMAYRWINRHLKGTNPPVTEPELPKIDGKLLRAFADELPADELNTKIDEVFVPLAMNTPPASKTEFASWQKGRLEELRWIVFRSVPENIAATEELHFMGDRMSSGDLTTETGITVPWAFHPARQPKDGQALWIVMYDEDDSASKPRLQEIGEHPLLLIAPRNVVVRWQDPAPFYVQRSLPLLGSTVDTGRLIDVLAATRAALRLHSGPVKLAGRG